MKLSWLRGARPVASSALLVVLAGACSSDPVGPDTTASALDPAEATAALEVYASNLSAAYTESVTDAEALEVKLQALVATPSAATLEAAKVEWLKSRQNYMLTEGARFYDGPIDAEPENYEGALNSWPFDEAYIDYVTDGPTRTEDGLPGDGGLIASDVPLTPENLDDLNAEGGDENISAGYHAVEFLLWGQAVRDVGPGERPFTDYDGNDAAHGDTAARRGQYLIAAVDGIVGHLKSVADAWKEGAPYRTAFVANEGNKSIVNVLSGLGKMSKGELAGERINAGLESKARRDQHNCFSSTTLVDYARDAQGIYDMWLGKHGAVDGKGIDELVAKSDQALADKITAQLKGSVDAIQSVSVPFEAAIQGLDTDPNRARLIGVRDSLRTQGDQMGEAAAALGLSLSVPDKN